MVALRQSQHADAHLMLIVQLYYKMHIVFARLSGKQTPLQVDCVTGTLTAVNNPYCLVDGDTVGYCLYTYE